MTTQTGAAVTVDTAAVRDAVTSAAAAELAATLAEHRSLTARETVARSRWLTPVLADRLARSAAIKIRHAVADNRSCPPSALGRLARDGKERVRKAALTNPTCPWDAVAMSDEVPAVINPGCPAELVAAEAARDRDHVRGLALRHPNLPVDVRGDLIRRLDRTDLRCLLENPALSHREALGIFERTGGDTVARWKWSAHPAADPAWLAEVADACFADADQGTIAHIAANPATPPATLARIVADHAHRNHALANPACPAEAMLASLTRTPDVDRKVTGYGYLSRARLMAVNPAATQPVLDVLDPSSLPGDAVYDFVLLHAATGPQAEVMLALARSWSGSLGDLVRATAATSIRPA